MKISYAWLQTHFEKPLPSPEKIAELVTMHTLELESREQVMGDTVFDFKVLPHRSHDCLGHSGFAKEVAVLTGLPSTEKSFEKVSSQPTEHSLVLSIEEPALCRRYAGRIIENVTGVESPEWLKKLLISIGERPINAIVDIMNYVMFETGQPMHAFDLEKLASMKEGTLIVVRKGKTGENMTTLDGKEVALRDVLIIADMKNPLAIAGIKGGKVAEVDASTRHVLLESANFEPIHIRKTAQKLGIRTEASKRFESEIAPQIVKQAIELATSLIHEIAPTKEIKIGEIVDYYPRVRRPYKIGVSAGEVNRVLGTALTKTDVARILNKLAFPYEIIKDPIAHVLATLPTFVGVPYKYGASISYDAPKSFDCSSFVSFLFAEAGVAVPRMTIDQYFFGTEVSKNDLQPGDIVFSSNHGSGEKTPTYTESKEFLPGRKAPDGIDHNGIHLGNGKIIHASGMWHKGSVVIEDLDTSPAFKRRRGYRRLFTGNEPRFVVTVPDERLDLMATRSFLVSGNKEDLIEEIGRVYGYENIPSVLPKNNTHEREINKGLHFANAIRSTLIAIGFSEVYTYALTDKGDVELENPMAEDKKFLRTNLRNGLLKSIALNIYNAPLLGLSQVKIFEIGKIFTDTKEYTSCALAVSKDKKNSAEKSLEEARKKLEEVYGGSIEGNIKDGVLEFDFDALVAKLPEGAVYNIPTTPSIMFKSISLYPFALRDIAVFVPSGVEETMVKKIIVHKAGDLLVRTDIFDRFEKGGKISYAFHLAFQSHQKTLSENELNNIMTSVAEALNANNGWQVR